MHTEQPDRMGRILLISIVTWGGLAGVVYVALTSVLPAPRPTHVATATAPAPTVATCRSALTLARAPGGLGPSRCGTAPAGALAATLSAWLDGAELEGAPTAPSPADDAALRERGRDLFARHCAGCHGPTGNGAGPDACALAVKPADLASGVFALRTTEHEELPTDDDLFRTISRGIHGTAMPPWFALDERDRWALVAYTKTLGKAFSDDVAPPPMKLGRPPAETARRLNHGRELYMQRGCASCHGELGRGDGPAAASLAVRPRNFTRGHFHRGSSLTDIHTTLSTGLDGTPMASFAKVMTADELWDVAMYVHSLAPPMTERGGMRCPKTPLQPVADERLGIEALMRTLPHELAIRRTSTPPTTEELP